ncbi:MAG TPA: CPBP family intramembrane glutamic endopeptidase [Phycisphaerae bacterium]|nr:CPBP family intramembrane glutamic endopeptidase [Phycisphaerae bacterium]
MDQEFHEIAPLSSEAVRDARPVESATVLPPVFPDVAMSRRAAINDIIILLGFMLCFALISLFAGISERLQERWPEGGRFLWVPMNGVFCLAVVTWLVRRRGQGAAAIGLGRARVGRVLLIALAAVPLCYLAGVISNAMFIAASGKGFIGFARERGQFIDVVAEIPLGWVVPLSIFAGIYEDIVFRGFLISRLQALSRSRAVPVVVSSLIFGGLHFTQGLPGMCQTALVGMVLAMVAVRARSIWPCMLAHAAVDTISLLVAVLVNPKLQEVLRQLTTQSAD